MVNPFAIGPELFGAAVSTSKVITAHVGVYVHLLHEFVLEIFWAQDASISHRKDG
jgi:hypothetical protein